MPTNYMFGNGYLSPKVNFAPSTTAALLNRPALAQQTATLDKNPAVSTLADRDVRVKRNQAVANFGTNYTQQIIDTANQKKQQVALNQQKQREQQVRTEDKLARQDASMSVPYSGPASGARAELVKQATSLVGTPYAWGGGGYGVRSSRGIGKGTQNVIGVDCSGLTSYVYSTIGVRLARQSDAQLKTAGYRTAVKNLQPGDLVGWAKGGHVAMYIGNGMIAEAPKPGAKTRIRQLGSYDTNNGVYGVHVSLPGE